MNRMFVLAALIAATCSEGAFAALITDDFEVNSSSSYTVVNDATPDGTQQFAFDYTAAGIPLAPRSAPGTRRGLRLTANDTVKPTNLVDSWTVFHSTPVAADFYTMKVDVWMNFAVATASTEYAQVGVGGNGTTFNSVFTPISGSGAFLAFTGDGGSASDYRWYRDTLNTPVGDAANTTLPNTHPSYLGNGSNNANASFTSLFPLGARPAPPNLAGTPGNMWTTVTIEVNNVAGLITFYMSNPITGVNGPMFQGAFAGTFNGLVSVGINDPFTSVDGGTVFTLYDNLEVFVPEPATGVMALVGLVGLARRRR
ncbi:MAG: PEP-CTERM sorting domain-containing protein [Lacipirellulaceae bacterium]